MEIKTKEDLVEHLQSSTIVLTPKLRKALLAVDRKDFVDEDYVVEAYNDYPLPIGYGQTISQPTIVTLMLYLLDPQEGERILDVGCGSGWTAVLLGFLVGREGDVVGIDIIEEFVELSRNRSSAYEGLSPNVAIFHASKEKQIYSDKFNKILVNASFSSKRVIPDIMKDNLKEGGIMVAPIANDLVIFTKKDGEFVEKKRMPYLVSFVPFVTD